MRRARFENRLLNLPALLLANASMLPVQLNAQQNDPEPLEEITVIGVRGSLLRSIESKYADQGFSDSISAKDLGKFPDLNVSESLQRIPGVTLNRKFGVQYT